MTQVISKYIEGYASERAHASNLMFFENIHQGNAGLAFDNCGEAVGSRPDHDRSRLIHWGLKERVIDRRHRHRCHHAHLGDPRWESINRKQPIGDENVRAQMGLKTSLAQSLRHHYLQNEKLSLVDV